VHNKASRHEDVPLLSSAPSREEVLGE